ncbi:MAG: flagellar protein FliT [Burkholderiales bacterium]
MSTYETLANRSAAMLDAARRSDWDVVIFMEQECSEIIGNLKSSSDVIPEDARARQRKTQIIRRMLIEDAEIRDLAQPQLARLARLIQVTGKQTRVEQAYT